MKKKVIYLLLLLALIAWFSTPEKRAARFVERNGEDFAALADILDGQAGGLARPFLLRNL